jgi:pantoate--beta-alanine ligase
MGYLHEGHLSLVKAARRAVGASGVVVVSVYVNPTQFGPGEDLSRYPRNFERDKELCRGAGVDVVFAPGDGGMYREGHSTYVIEEVLSQGWEGAVRPAHFRGVTTVVAKLFNLVLPSVAVFGAKDYQQTQVVRRMIRDLNFPVRLLVCPTFREKDGLAMSSRNVYLSSDERRRAAVLARAIRRARQLARSRRGGISVARIDRELRGMIEAQDGVALDYAGYVDSETLEPKARAKRGMRVVLAARVGKTRLIDNGGL